MEGVLSSRDEADLFQIANKFAIRHRRPDQKGDYDPGIWLPWIFYWYLAAVYAVLEAIDRRADSA